MMASFFKAETETMAEQLGMFDIRVTDTEARLDAAEARHAFKDGRYEIIAQEQRSMREEIDAINRSPPEGRHRRGIFCRWNFLARALGVTSRVGLGFPPCRAGGHGLVPARGPRREKEWSGTRRTTG